MSEQVWRPVLGYEGYYEVSNDGQVRSLDREYLSKAGRRLSYKGRVMKLKFQHYYLRVGLSKHSVTTNWCVHRLVCDAFHGAKPNPGAVIRHLNGDHLDNRAENLTCGTPAENTADMMRHGRHYWTNKTHCKRNHEFTPDNTEIYTAPGGKQRRVCLQCKRRHRARPPDYNARKRKRPVALFCRVCGTRFDTAYRQKAYCSSECKRVSRTVDFKRRRFAA